MAGLRRRARRRAEVGGVVIQMKPEKKEIPLNDEEKLLMKELKTFEGPAALADLKSKTGLSNKKWDKTIKGLKKLNLIEVAMVEDILSVTQKV